jgi:hypothetical protein
MSSAPKSGKKGYSGPSVGPPAQPRGVKGFTPGRTMDTQVSNPANARGKAGGSMDTPTSTKSNIVQPAKAPKPTPDSRINNVGK